MDDNMEPMKPPAQRYKVNQADSMKRLFLDSCTRRVYAVQKNPPNPLWMEFPTKCVRTIQGEKQMREMLKHYASSDDVMVVRYWQDNCTACNALDKIFEYLCFESKDKLPNLHFYDVKRESNPALVKGLVRFPQIKAFSGGQWADMDFKPPKDFREIIYNDVERRVQDSRKRGEALSALQAEEMYFSASAPTITNLLEDSLTNFYVRSQVRMHNYWKQVSVRRTWFFKKHLQGTDEDIKRSEGLSVFGEQIARPMVKREVAPEQIPEGSQ